MCGHSPWGQGLVGMMVVGLSDLRSLFQPKQFCASPSMASRSSRVCWSLSYLCLCGFGEQMKSTLQDLLALARTGKGFAQFMACVEGLRESCVVQSSFVQGTNSYQGLLTSAFWVGTTAKATGLILISAQQEKHPAEVEPAMQM